jgi:hypothetical protein
VPLPAWLVPIIRAHRTRWPTASDEPVFANEVGAPLRRTLFRSRIWRPSCVRAGLLGEVASAGGGFEAQWADLCQRGENVSACVAVAGFTVARNAVSRGSVPRW